MWNLGYYEIYYQSQTKLLIAKRSFKFTLTSLQLSRTVQLWNLEGFLGKKLWKKIDTLKTTNPPDRKSEAGTQKDRIAAPKKLTNLRPWESVRMASASYTHIVKINLKNSYNIPICSELFFEAYCRSILVQSSWKSFHLQRNNHDPKLFRTNLGSESHS